jgi:hypothetical protein
MTLSGFVEPAKRTKHAFCAMIVSRDPTTKATMLPFITRKLVGVATAEILMRGTRLDFVQIMVL